MSTPEKVLPKDLFIVCGLGSLGQYCAANLKEFGVKVVGIELTPPSSWEVENFPEQLERLVVGDCCQGEVLQAAGIHQARAILFVTSDERINISAAFAARSLNPTVRLVVRSAQENLNQLLAEQVGNFVAYEATQLPAASFALAALGSNIQGVFILEEQPFQVFTVQIGPNHRWCDRRQLFELQGSNRRILEHRRGNQPVAENFYDWEPQERLHSGDIVSYVEITETLTSFVPTENPAPKRGKGQNLARLLHWGALRQKVSDFWKGSSQAQRAAIVSAVLMLVLSFSCAGLYRLQYPDMSLLDAINASVLLIFGNFDGLYADRVLEEPPPWWLYIFSVFIMVAGTLFIGILYALLTERVLAARFQFAKRRPPLPKAGHTVVIGLGRVGQRVVKILQDLKQPVVGVGSANLAPDALPDLPLVTGSAKDSLDRVNLETAKSVLLLTDDEVANLELGLMVRQRNPRCNLVIRSLEERFAKSVGQLLPGAKVLGIYAQAAEVFVGSAFGENILHSFRLGDRTTLVTEYNIEEGDTLCGYLISQVAYGYGLVPILHQHCGHDSGKLMPSEDIRLEAGDRLVVLADTDDLQRVEQGKIAPRRWLVRVEKVAFPNSEFDGMQTIARISGCDVSVASTLMHNLPGTLPCPLYKHQALRMIRALSKLQIRAHLLAAPM